MRLVAASLTGCLSLFVAATSANADGAAYVGSGAFKTCDQFTRLKADDPTLREFQDWTYGYWSAHNQINIHTAEEVKNLAHASVLGEAFFERMRTQCMDQPDEIMMAIIQQVYMGLPNYE